MSHSAHARLTYASGEAIYPLALLLAIATATDPSSTSSSYTSMMNAQPGCIIPDENKAIPTLRCNEQSDSDIWNGSERVGTHHPALPNSPSMLLRKRPTWESVLRCLRTFFALRRFHEAHAENLLDSAESRRMEWGE
ncbi:hypothetical protein WOLCODRAFT_157885 [Wolfiporia cocos MD-104 SS10]|uniref:Uncharacterized protein n=1 Tax=Wolfiporia cocos (strain MD-104) TaxID=742152 RepID=A0A2H3JBJ3_WOLCO|nr:hypothetical protein WOLCODRAFT_157885 [Wolfiporia cocos MD-104 SS10]